MPDGQEKKLLGAMVVISTGADDLNTLINNGYRGIAFMSDLLPDWPRNHFERSNGRPFLFYVLDDWKHRIFDPAGAVPRHHVVVFTSEESNSNLTWFHTRGLRKFGRPDLSIHNVPVKYHGAIIDLCERFIELQAFGGVIREGQEIRMGSVPQGMTCHHNGDLDDPDFNNVHVEIVGIVGMVDE